MQNQKEADALRRERAEPSTSTPRQAIDVTVQVRRTVHRGGGGGMRSHGLSVVCGGKRGGLLVRGCGVRTRDRSVRRTSPMQDGAVLGRDGPSRGADMLRSVKRGGTARDEASKSKRTRHGAKRGDRSAAGPSVAKRGDRSTAGPSVAKRGDRSAAGPSVASRLASAAPKTVRCSSCGGRMRAPAEGVSTCACCVQGGKAGEGCSSHLGSCAVHGAASAPWHTCQRVTLVSACGTGGRCSGVWVLHHSTGADAEFDDAARSA